MRGVPPGGVADGRVPAGAGCCANAGDAADTSSATPAMALSDFAVMLVPLHLPPSPTVSVPHGGPPVNHARRVSSGRETFYKPFMADPASDPLAWRQLKAPSLVELEVLASEVFRRLPSKFRDLCVDLVIQVDDFPTDEVLDQMGAESEFDLLGLFQGVGLPFRSESAPVQMPNMIWLYRRPILDYWAEHDETLGAIVRHVLAHEVGHHFGLSDDDMAAIEGSAEEARGVVS
jgi:predicted Zn-dependent protease with MMP-like domain